MPSLLLRELTLDDIDRLATAPAVDEPTMQTAAEICRAVWADGNPAAGEAAVREFASKFGELESDEPLLLSKAQIEPYVERIDAATREMLQRTRDRIVKFAEAQLSALNEMSIPVCGGKAGHDILPIERVGCYAPAGRYPLPSTVLMTAAVARAAGCQHVCLATPRPGELMLATAAIAGADCVLTVGGAQAIAAMAYGTESVESVDLIVGPGNQWVTAAKQFVSQRIGIDMLAGPSELTIIADSSADPTAVAADLLAQAEHDPAARTFLITDDASLPADVNEQLELQLQDLATADTARLSLANGGFFVANSRDHCAGVADRLGPEHLQIQTRNARELAGLIQHAGCIFIGHYTAEVFGDYGLGPNHTLPTGNTARTRGGLSVFDFCRVRTWIELDQALDPETQNDISLLAGLEGLAGHRAASLVPRGPRSQRT